MTTIQYDDEFINWVDIIIDGVAEEEQELSKKNVKSIIINDWKEKRELPSHLHDFLIEEFDDLKRIEKEWG